MPHESIYKSERGNPQNFNKEEFIMDMNKIFSGVAKDLFNGKLVFDGMAASGSTTKQVLEKAKTMMAEAADTCEGVIGEEDSFETFKNAKESAEYLLSLMAEGVFPQEATPYDSDWGRTFDSICGSCLNISFAYALLKGMGDDIVVTDDVTNSDEVHKAAETAKAEEARKAEEAAKAEEARKAEEAAKAEKARKAEARKAEIARQAKAAAVAETEKATTEAAKAKNESKVEAEAGKDKKSKKGLLQKAKEFLSGDGEDEDDEPKPKPKRSKKKSADILEDFVDE